MAALRGELEILRVIVAAAENDEVLQTSGDEELPVIDEAEVTSAEVVSPVFTVDGRAEAASCFLGVVPIPAGHARPADPDLADAALGTRAARLGIDDAH